MPCPACSSRRTFASAAPRLCQKHAVKSRLHRAVRAKAAQSDYDWEEEDGAAVATYSAPEQSQPAEQAQAEETAPQGKAKNWLENVTFLPDPPDDQRYYETMIILSPELSDDERDQELARFESYLLQVCCNTRQPR
jgi:hypothetical protein